MVGPFQQAILSRSSIAGFNSEKVHLVKDVANENYFCRLQTTKIFLREGTIRFQ
jgi:hypothetical protein